MDIQIVYRLSNKDKSPARITPEEVHLSLDVWLTLNITIKKKG